MKQQTIAQAFSFEGKGLHTGLDIKLNFVPAPEGTGICIKRIDLEGEPTYPALADYVSATERGTVLKKGDWQVSTIEHAMAALYAFQIDNCILEVNAPEFPILNGSADLFVAKLQEVGVTEQNASRDVFVVTKKIEYIAPNGKSRITLLPDDKFSVDVHIGFESEVLNNQFATLDNLSDFAEQIAPARTFVFVREIELLLQNNLIKGGDLDNAIVVYDQVYPQERIDEIAALMNQPSVKAEKLGYLNGALKFDNEPARHKLLDVIGDLALTGKQIQGKVIARYPGHTVNTALAKQIRKQLRKQDVQAPVYDDTVPPIFDINQIKALLPHRYPFLMVDKIIAVTERSITGVKNVTNNEPFFQGHFPEEPVMPGVLHLEAMAQTGGILILHDKEEAERYSTYFLKINNVKFRRKIVPGDTLIFYLELIDDVRRGIATMRGYTFVGGEIATEAEFTAQIIKNK